MSIFYLVQPTNPGIKIPTNKKMIQFSRVLDVSFKVCILTVSFVIVPVEDSGQILTAQRMASLLVFNSFWSTFAHRLALLSHSG